MSKKNINISDTLPELKIYKSRLKMGHDLTKKIRHLSKYFKNLPDTHYSVSKFLRKVDKTLQDT